MNKTLTSFNIVPLVISTHVPENFPLVEAPLKSLRMVRNSFAHISKFLLRLHSDEA